MDINIQYEPLPFAKDFHASAAPFRLVVGGKGSGKSVSMMEEGFMLSTEYPKNTGLLARATYGELQEVIIDPLLDLIPPELIREYRKADRKLILTNGSVIYFRPLDDARKLKGLTLGWFGVDEVDSVDEDVWLQLVGQLRKPGVRHVGMATTNPTSTDHWVYERFVRAQLAGHEVFRAPTGENIHVPRSFIDNLLITMPESWRKRYLDGQWGTISHGDRVYPDFSEKIHIYRDLVYNPSLPVLRFWDFGLNGNAVIFAQPRGSIGLDILNELFKKNYTSRLFAMQVRTKSDELFPDAVFDDIGDIAGWHDDVTSGTSPIMEAQAILGSDVKIRTNQVSLKDSLELVRIKLSQIAEGNSAIRIHPKAKLLVEGFNGGYVFKKNKDGSIVRDVPAEDQVFEHVMDALRYGIWDRFRFDRKDARKKSRKLPEYKTEWEGTSW